MRASTRKVPFPWLVLGAAAAILLGVTSRAHAQAGQEVEYYALDAVGSVRVVFDANGVVKGRMDYAPFGEELYSGLFMPSERFAQLTRDGEAGLDYAQARMYQPRTGRFNAVDPVYAGLFEPQAWNRYDYAVNRPTSLADPSGLCPDRSAYCEDVNVIARAPLIPTFFWLSSATPQRRDVPDESLRLQRRFRREGRARTPPPGGPQDPPQPKPPNDCQEFVQTLTSAVQFGTGSPDPIRRTAGLIGTGGGMAVAGLAAYAFDLLGDKGAAGFHRVLVEPEQGNDLYSHILVNAGFTAMGFRAGVSEMIRRDARDIALGRAWGAPELIDDIVGAEIGNEMTRVAFTANFMEFQKRVTTLLCK
jgi:RHS repeat-associated protein